MSGKRIIPITCLLVSLVLGTPTSASQKNPESTSRSKPPQVHLRPTQPADPNTIKSLETRKLREKLAAKVLDPNRYFGSAVRGYKVAKEIPDILNQLFCYNGTDVTHGHRTLLENFFDGCGADDHESQCYAAIAYDLYKKGLSIAEIQKTIDEKFSPYYPWSKDSPAFIEYQTKIKLYKGPVPRFRSIQEPSVPQADLETKQLRARLAAKVLDPNQFTGSVKQAYQIAKEIPDILNQLFCYEGSDITDGHKTMLDGFTTRYATDCLQSYEEAKLAYDLYKRGATVAEIQRAVDEKFSPTNPWKEDSPAYIEYKTKIRLYKPATTPAPAYKQSLSPSLRTPEFRPLHRSH